MKDGEGVSKEVILELHKGEYGMRDAEIDWETAAPLTIIKENMEVNEA